jgi:3-dehydroquinate synthase
MSTVNVAVALGARSYEIRIGQGLLAVAAAHIAPVLRAPRVIVVVDRAVEEAAKTLMADLVTHGIRAEILTIAAGEATKSFAGFADLAERILALRPDRKTTLIACGGGVAGDLVGFVASVLLRGLDFIQVPTTLLAQVDSSVGGKTGINTRAGKNLVGSFYQPRLVLIDLDVLATLPPRELRAGYAEIIKYGLIMDAEFFAWCEHHGAALIEGDAAYRARAIAACCQMKAQIVGADEQESDLRALLNFGHTFGHALEAEAGYDGSLLHGEAVALGMVMGCRLSEKLGLLAEDTRARLVAHLQAVGMKSSLKETGHPWQAEKIAAHFMSDKKTENGALTFIVLDDVGRARIQKNVAPELAGAVVAEMVEGTWSM